MTTAGDVAALLGSARSRIRTARAEVVEWVDPHATLRAWSASGPWQEAARTGDPLDFGLPAEAGETVSRQWLDLAGDRAREERAGVVLVRDGARWWSYTPGAGLQSGTSPESSVDLAAVLSIWTDPQPLTRALELEVAGEEDGVIRVPSVSQIEVLNQSARQTSSSRAREN